MTWPTSDASTTNVSADTNSPALARADLKALIEKFNQVRNHVTSYMRTVLAATDASSARALIGGPLGYKYGFDLDFPQDGTTMTIGPGEATDSTGAAVMRIAAPMTKNLDAWAVGSGNGSLDEGSAAANAWYHVYEVQRSDTGVVDIVSSLTPPGAARTATITIATPGVVTETGHGRAAGSRVVFATTGALPTGLTAGTAYYVISSGLTADAYQVSATQGGSAINTSGSQSGTHSVASGGPKLPTSYTYYRWLGFVKLNGSTQFNGLRKRGDTSEWTHKRLQTYTYGDGTDVLTLTYSPPGMEVQASGVMYMISNDPIGAVILPVGGGYDDFEGYPGAGAALATAGSGDAACGQFGVITNRLSQVYLIIDPAASYTDGYFSVHQVRDFNP